MTRFLALGIVLVVAYQARAFGALQPFELRTTDLALGFALIAATVTGGLVERLHLPRLSGYLLFGVACGPYVADIISRPMARELQLVNGLAVALIAFIAGLELHYGRLRGRLRMIASFGAVTLVVTYIGLFVLLFAIWPWLPIVADARGVERAALAAILTILVASFSPTVTIAVIAETRARGPLGDLVMALVVLADLVLILAFALTMQIVRGVLDEHGSEAGLAVQLLWEIGGSIAFGALLGAGFGLYLRHIGRELTVGLLALCWLLSEAGHGFGFEPLLAALAAGLIVGNLTRGELLRDAIERGSLPILVVFFAGAGASLHLDVLGSVQLAGLVLIVSGSRIGLLRLGTRLASKLVEPVRAHDPLVWMGLVSQAGVTLGLAVAVATQFPEWGARAQTFIVALVALHELAGPILFRLALARSGEIGMMDRPPASAPSSRTAAMATVTSGSGQVESRYGDG